MDLEHRSRLGVTHRFFAAAILIALADPAHSQPQGAAASAERAITRLEASLKNEYGIRIVHAAKEIPACTWKIEFQPAEAHDLPSLASYLELFAFEFRKYPKAFIERSGLETVALGKGLSIGGQRRAALPDYYKETLYYDFAFVSTRSDYLRHVVHHEFYHMLEQEWNGSAYFKDPKWAALNQRGFRYGPGGAKARRPGVGAFDHPAKGFINRYAMSGLEEDKAETWAVMFVPSEWKLVARWLKRDSILRKKVRVLERFARQQCTEMNATFWQRIRARSR